MRAILLSILVACTPKVGPAVFEVRGRAELAESPDREDDADLAPLAEGLRGVQVVFLGGTGRVADAVRWRLVGYLHRELGFETLVLPGEMHSCQAGDRDLRQGVDPELAVARCDWPDANDAPAWLAEHLRPSARGRLRLAGMDCVGDGDARLKEDLDAFVRTHALPAGHHPDRDVFDAMVDDLLTFGVVERYDQLHGEPYEWEWEDLAPFRPSPSARASFFGVLRALEHDAEALHTATGDGWRALLANLGGLAKMTWSDDLTGATQARLDQMARNVLFHARDGRRVMVWGDGLDGAPDLDRVRPRWRSAPARTVGDTLRDELGDGYYLLVVAPDPARPASGADGRRLSLQRLADGWVVRRADPGPGDPPR